MQSHRPSKWELQSRVSAQSSRAVEQEQSFQDYLPSSLEDLPYDQSESALDSGARSGSTASSDASEDVIDQAKRPSGIVAQARLRATFYPKFENEKSDQEVRTKMIEVVGKGRGVLEVSLKHSGSLFMYSGDRGGAYAKNSSGNLYTAVGVFVLGKTLQAAWGEQAAEKQREFNAYLEAQHLCVSMELVTAVLGDHGQRPQEDYVVVTAIANLEGKPHFYSTPDVIAFCWQWRLPTNNVWLFSSRKSAISFFTAYDALCEEGTATVVSKTLDEISDISIPATKSHSEVQGEILEGLVARIVPSKSLEQMQKVLQDVPFFRFEGSYGIPSEENLREICAKNKASEKQQVDALLQSVGLDMCSNWSDWESDNRDSSLFNRFVKALPADSMTAKLKELIQVIRRRNMKVRFPCRVVGQDEQKRTHFKLTIHVLNDSVFRKYQKEMSMDLELWPLYRGFFADIYLFDGTEEKPTCTSSNNSLQIAMKNDDIVAGETEHLMLKMKFLPYKIRTFLIRNGLSVLFQKGFSAYKTYYLRQMDSWTTSSDKRRQLDGMLMEWAKFITDKYKGKGFSSKVYLSEAEPFLAKFAKRSLINQRLVGFAGNTIRTENFLFDFPDEDEPLPGTEATVQTGISDDFREKGILVFFPGIPGCGKSALCQELLKEPNVLAERRTMHTMMGDRVKGRYWPQLAKEHKRQKRTFTLADKNAPNVEVWALIEDICQSSSSVGIPVVPDSQGTESNPFSLDSLAMFIYRILQREQHPGNLDKDSTNVGYVLLMFYHLYEGKDRTEFENDLKGRFGYLVKQPILKESRPTTPSSVLEVVMQGIDLYHRHTAEHGRLDSTKGYFRKEWSDWEKRMRGVINRNAEYFQDVQVPFEDVVRSVRQQLTSIINGEVSVETPMERSFRSVTYAALSFPVKDVVNVLSQISHLNKDLEAYIIERKLSSDLKGRPHLTLAHKGTHGVAAVAAFGQFRDASVRAYFTGIVFSAEMCAFEVKIPHNEMGINSRNEWPHITIWTAEGTKAKEANQLPKLVVEGKACRVDLPEAVEVLGNVEIL